jgi:hypothetical protein
MTRFSPDLSFKTTAELLYLIHRKDASPFQRSFREGSLISLPSRPVIAVFPKISPAGQKNLACSGGPW